MNYIFYEKYQCQFSRTLEYMAIEMAKGEAYSFPVDWWCFGILLYILVERRYPFPNGNAIDHKSLTFGTDLKFESASPDLSSLISKVCSKQLVHKYLEDYSC